MEDVKVGDFCKVDLGLVSTVYWVEIQEISETEIKMCAVHRNGDSFVNTKERFKETFVEKLKPKYKVGDKVLTVSCLRVEIGQIGVMSSGVPKYICTDLNGKHSSYVMTESDIAYKMLDEFTNPFEEMLEDSI